MPKRSSFAASALALAVSSAFAQSGSDSKYQLAYLDPVVVTASRFQEFQSAASAPVEVISRQEIESSGASNFVEFLDSVPGTTISRLYGRLGIDATVDIGYFGADFGAQNVLVLVDGQRLNPFDQGSIIWSQIPVSIIDRVEVRRANGGVLYGDRAQGGVINVITRHDNSTEAGLSVGSFGYRKADAYLGFAAANIFGNIAVLDARSDGYRNYSSANQSSGQATIATDTSIGIFSVSGRIFTENARQPGALTIPEYLENPRQISTSSTGDTNRAGQSLSLRYESKEAATNGLVMDVFDSSVKRQSIAHYPAFTYGSVLYPAFDATTDIENKRTSFAPEYRYTVGSNKLVIGGELYKTSANTKENKQVNQTGVAAYLQNSYKFFWGAVFDVGYREQTIDNRFQSNSAAEFSNTSFKKSASSVGVRIPLADSLQLRTGFLTGYRFANADELYYFKNGGNYDPYKANPGVNPSSSHESYLELRYQKSSIYLSGLYRSIKTKDEIGVRYDCLVDNGISYACNSNLYDTQRNVYSVVARWRPTQSFSLVSSIDLVDARIDSGEYAGKYVPLTPRHAFRLTAEQHVQGVALLASVHNRGRMFASSDNSNAQPVIPARSVYDVGLRSSGIKNSWSWSVWIRNLANKSYYDFAAWDGYSLYGVYPADGRSGEFNIRYKF